MSHFITDNQVEVFIGLEILSLLFLLTFLILRYATSKHQVSKTFLGLFIFCIFLEACLAVFIYQQIGEISTLQVVIIIFVIYAFTFGIADFKKLDRFIKRKVGEFRGVNLLTEADVRQMEREKDYKYIARKNRIWWYTHAFVFVIVHYLFWIYDGNHAHDLMYYLSDFSWWKDSDVSRSPFQSEGILQASMLWSIIFILDTIISWSYTLFPDKKKSA